MLREPACWPPPASRAGPSRPSPSFVPGLQHVILIEWRLRQTPYSVPGLTHVVALSRRPGDGKSYITCKDKRFKSISNGEYCFVDEDLMLLDLKRVHVDGPSRAFLRVKAHASR